MHSREMCYGRKALIKRRILALPMVFIGTYSEHISYFKTYYVKVI